MNTEEIFSKMSKYDQAKIIIVTLLLIGCVITIFLYYNTMPSMMQIGLILFAIVLFSYLIYIFFTLFLSPVQFQNIGPDDISLSTETQVITSESLKTLWSSKAGSTLIFYINPVINDRTGQSGNEYANVVKIGSKQTFKILVAPDAGRDMSLSPAIFEIYTKGNTEPERIEISKFPMQKWTCVVIVKKGRKFNIYLDGKLTLSHTCTAMPDFDTTVPLTVGDSRLSGTISLMSITPRALNTPEVQDLVSQSVDTSGKPYKPIKLYSLFSYFIPELPSLDLILANLWCPAGNCNTPKKAGPMEEWSSPYA
jgi:hypothetical protein